MELCRVHVSTLLIPDSACVSVTIWTVSAPRVNSRPSWTKTRKMPGHRACTSWRRICQSMPVRFIACWKEAIIYNCIPRPNLPWCIQTASCQPRAGLHGAMLKTCNAGRPQWSIHLASNQYVAIAHMQVTITCMLPIT